MKIEYLERPHIDSEKWDQCISASLNGNIYAYSSYLDQVTPDWGALIYNDFEAVMPLPRRKKWGIWYVVQPLFVQQLGVFSPQPVNQDLLTAFLNNVPGHIKYVNYNFNIHNKLNSWSNATLTQRSTYELDLIPEYSIIRQGYSSQTKRNLKKAQKESVYVLKASEASSVINAFRNHKGKQIKAFSDDDYNTLLHLISSALYRGNAQIYHAYGKQNNFCSGAVFFFSHRKAIMIFTGSTAEARENGALTAIIDHFIKENATKHLTLDFEGSSDMNLARFYSGFGSKECLFLQLEWVNLPPLVGGTLKLLRQIKNNTLISTKTT